MTANTHSVARFRRRIFSNMLSVARFRRIFSNAKTVFDSRDYILND